MSNSNKKSEKSQISNPNGYRLKDNPIYEALHWARLGANLTRIQYGTKKAIDKDWINTQTNYQDVAGWYHSGNKLNYGINLGLSGLCVIDIDTKNGGDLGSLDLTNEELKTIYVLSASTGKNGLRGQHIYYRLPNGIEATRNLDLAQGVEFLAKGQANGPGSWVNNVQYQYVNGHSHKELGINNLDDIPLLPQKIIDLINSIREEKARSSQTSSARVSIDDNGQSLIGQPGFEDRDYNSFINVVVAGEIRRIVQAQKGDRNNTLNSAAYNLGRYAWTGGQIIGGMDIDDALDMFIDAAVQNGLPENEASKTALGAYNAGKTNPKPIYTKEYPKSTSTNGNGRTPTDIPSDQPTDEDYIKETSYQQGYHEVYYDDSGHIGITQPVGFSENDNVRFLSNPVSYAKGILTRATNALSSKGCTQATIQKQTFNLARYVGGGHIDEQKAKKPIKEACQRIGLDPQLLNPIWKNGLNNPRFLVARDESIETQYLEYVKGLIDEDAIGTPTYTDFVQFMTESEYKLRFNEMDLSVEYSHPRETDDKWQMLSNVASDIIVTALYDLDHRNISITEKRIQRLASNVPIHPIRDYFKSIEWDGKPRFDDFASCFEDIHSVFPLWLKKFMLGCINKTFTGKQNHTLLMLGKQGLGKSTFVEWLTPKSEDIVSSLFYAGPLMTKDKDTEMRMVSKFLWEVGEFEGLYKRQEIAEIKFMLTREEITYRPPYGRRNETKTVTANYIGTSNKTDVLRDETGHRRYLATELTSIDWQYANFDRDQIWAEIYHYWKNGETHVLNTKEKNLQTQINGHYEESVSDDLEQAIQFLFVIDAHNAMKYKAQRDFNWWVSMFDIKKIINNYNSNIHISTKGFEVGHVATALGLAKDRIRINGKKITGYFGLRVDKK